MGMTILNADQLRVGDVIVETFADGGASNEGPVLTVERLDFTWVRYTFRRQDGQVLTRDDEYWHTVEIR